MSLLLDTHVVLWWLTDDATLPDEIKARLDHEPDVFVSAATIWEVAIKQAIGRLPEPSGLPELIQDSGFAELPVTSRHAARRDACRSFTVTPLTGCLWRRLSTKT